MSRANPRFHRINPALPSLVGQTAFRLVVQGIIDSQIWLCNLDYIWTAGSVPNVNAEANLAANFITAAATQWRACMAADVNLGSVKAQCLTIPSRQPFINNFAAGLGNGTVAGQHLPSEMAGIISKYTNFKGQHGRGRIYLPGVPVSFTTPTINANLLNGTANTAYQALATALLTTITDGTNNYNLGVTTRTRGGLATTQGALLPVATGLIVKLLLGTVRRRRLGRGK